ncbi:MAG: hypothetical protein ACRDHP_01865 [Ktedonobacterales bacterium]
MSAPYDDTTTKTLYEPQAAQSAPMLVVSAPPTREQLPSAGPRRMWPAVLVLFFLAPMVGEMLSGSTPPLAFINPVSLALEAGLYGSGAVLIRELTRGRGRGWASVVLLGAAYGILEEGLVVTSWFNPYWPDAVSLGTYGRALDTNWIWALGLTAYHAVVSITIPILLVELIFPRIGTAPWMGRRGVRRFAVALAVVSTLELLGFGFLMFRKQGYTHPPLMFFGAAALAAVLLWLGLHLRLNPLLPSSKPLPGLWKLRLAALGTTVAFFVTIWVFPSIVRPAVVTGAAIVAVVVFGVWRVRTWAARPGWSAEQRLALASGAMGFFLLLAPIIELSHPGGKPTQGMTLAALLWLAGLVALALRTGRRARGAANLTPSV